MPIIVVVLIAVSAFFLGSSFNKKINTTITTPTPLIKFEETQEIKSQKIDEDFSLAPTTNYTPVFYPTPTYILPTVDTEPDSDLFLTIQKIQRDTENQNQTRTDTFPSFDTSNIWDQHDLDCLEKQGEYTRCLAEYNSDYNDYLNCMNKCRDNPYAGYKYGTCMCYKPFKSCIQPMFCH